VVPFFIGIVVDAMEDKDTDLVGKYCLIMLVICLVSAITSGWRGTVFNTMSEKIALELRYDIVYFLINKDVAFFDENKTGDLLSRISADT